MLEKYVPLEERGGFVRMTQDLINLLKRVGPIRRWIYFMERVPPFMAALFSEKGLHTKEGRLLVWGKFRRGTLSIFPSLALALRKHYKLEGSCVSCGASCNLLFQCPQWDPKTRLCTIYEDRPSICRTFPITPADLRDRNIMKRDQPCGFSIAKLDAPRNDVKK